jgi:MerR family transcriptional regulator, light-induced transcriptional regulator
MPDTSDILPELAGISSEIRNTYIEALLRGDKRACADIVTRLLDQGLPVRTLFIDLFQDSLYRVGRLWEMNRISVATEHLATSVTLMLFQIVYPIIFAVPRNGRSAIVACTTNEYHHIGARMVSNISELHGWDSHFVGASTPVADLCRLVEEMRPDILAISITLYANVGNLLYLIERVRMMAPTLPIIVGGQAFLYGGAEFLANIPHVNFLRTLNEFEDYLDTPKRIGATVR